MSSFLPEGLSATMMKELDGCVLKAQPLSLDSLIALAREHMVQTHAAYKKNPILDLALAESLLGTIETVVKEWSSIPPYARDWCKGMILYFVAVNKEQNDHASPIGFDDDAEVINACLRVAGRDDLCIDPEECAGAV
jgi:hypothetical protein